MCDLEAELVEQLAHPEGGVDAAASKLDARRWVEVDAQLVGDVGRRRRAYGHTWNPRQPWFTAQTMWARSAATSASLVVPLGVATSRVWSQSGAPFGTRFWNHDLPPGAVGVALEQQRPVTDRAHERLADGQVVARRGRASSRPRCLKNTFPGSTPSTSVPATSMIVDSALATSLVCSTCDDWAATIGAAAIVLALVLAGLRRTTTVRRPATPPPRRPRRRSTPRRRRRSTSRRRSPTTATSLGTLPDRPARRHVLRLHHHAGPRPTAATTVSSTWPNCSPVRRLPRRRRPPAGSRTDYFIKNDNTKLRPIVVLPEAQVHRRRLRRLLRLRSRRRSPSSWPTGTPWRGPHSGEPSPSKNGIVTAIEEIYFP